MTSTGAPSGATASRLRIGWPLAALWCTAAFLISGAIGMAFWYAPIDPVQGPIQKIFYLHLGAAISTLIGAGGVFAGSVVYLWQRDPRWDRLADASARMAVLLLLVVLITGSIWAKRVWGIWWEWSPPLTFSLVLWLLYLGYLLVRSRLTDPQRRAAVGASIGLLASLDVPLVYLSVRFLPHSSLSRGEPAPESAHTMAVWIVAVAVLTVCVIWTRTRKGASVNEPRQPTLGTPHDRERRGGPAAPLRAAGHHRL